MIRLKQLCKEDKVSFEFPNDIMGNPEMMPGEGMENGDQPYNPYGSQMDMNNYQQGGLNANNNFGGFSQYNSNNNMSMNNPYGGDAFGQQPPNNFQGGFDNYGNNNNDNNFG